MNDQKNATGNAVVEDAIAKLYTNRIALSAATAWKRAKWGAAVIIPLLTVTAHGAEAAASQSASTNAAPAVTTFAKPDWLTDLSIGIKESYDDNVFLAGAKSSQYPAGTDLSKVPSSIALAVRDKSSFVTAVSPKVGVNFAPLIGDQHLLQVLSLGYAPDFVTYHDRSSESYNAHRLAATVKGKANDFSFNLENSFNDIEGNKFGPLFPGGLNSAYATAAARERRNQYQDRSTAVLQYDIDKFFIRPTASLLYYDLRTEQLTRAQAGGQSGYQNYADRYDVNGGADLGYRITPKIAATVGYRYGAQYQELYSRAVDSLLVAPGVYGLSSSSDYQRILLGVEGKPLSWLDAKFQIGPDFRSYGVHADVDDHRPVTYYGEASLTATVTSKDSVSFKYKQYQWVSSTGRVPYFDSTYDLSYRRKLTDKLSLDLGARFLQSDYTSGLNTASQATFNAKQQNPRNDTQTTLGIGLAYAFNSHASVSLGYSLDLGRNAQNDIANESTREFDHSVVTLGANLKF